MSTDPPKDEGLDQLLQEIVKNIGENQRFLQSLKEDRIDDLDEPDTAEETEDGFEEL